MRAGDLARFAAASLIRSPGRTFLMLLAMSIGVSAVVVLTGLGEGARRYITGEFASLGTNLVIVIPGRSETTGGAPAIMAGETPRDLTIEDYLALTRNPLVKQAAPVMVGAAGAAYGRLEREITVVGTTSEYMKIRHMAVDRGKFLPPGDPSRAVNVCVIGKKIRQELFGNEQALGEWLRLGDRRFRVIGILGSSGRSLGVDLQELVIIPVASAQALFNSPGLFRILVEARSRDSMPRLQDQIRKTVARRHQGEEDITVVTQDAVLATFDNILRALTFTVGGIGAISLAVAGILIMNIMLVAVSQRVREIGLLKAVGARRGQLTLIFLSEAVMLASLGGVLGLLLGYLGTLAIHGAYPDLDAQAPGWAIAAALGVSSLTGLVFGIMPARRAAAMEAVAALRG
ncbi:MAG: ABC transporter permease [Gammaproteobacteria bacterium]|nr:ABC transporter permease [Gammaproteobacteria bacterium]